MTHHNIYIYSIVSYFQAEPNSTHRRTPITIHSVEQEQEYDILSHSSQNLCLPPNAFADGIGALTEVVGW